MTWSPPATDGGSAITSNGPVAGIGIDVFDLNGNKSLTVWTNTRGEYTSTALKSGDYKVRFMPGYYGGYGLVEQWWNNKGTEAVANIISLGPEEQKTGVNAQLQPIGNATAPGVPTDVQVAGGRGSHGDLESAQQQRGLPITRYNVEGAPYGACETLGDQICTIKGLDNG